MEPLRGREYFDNAQVQGEATHRIRIRYRGGITPAWRALWGSRAFEFVEVLNPSERNRSLEIMAKEVVA